MAVNRDPGQSVGEEVFRWAVTSRAPLYALLDAARASDGPRQAEQAGLPFQSLLAGELGAELSDVAPYLVEFRDRSSFGRWWFEQWGQSVGVLLEAPTGLDKLRAHLRTLLIVRHEDGQKYFFRFYDPRVSRVFLPNCTRNEAMRFFGPITAIHCEGEGGKELLTYKLDRSGVSIKQSPVPAPEPARAPRRRR